MKGKNETSICVFFASVPHILENIGVMEAKNIKDDSAVVAAPLYIMTLATKNAKILLFVGRINQAVYLIDATTEALYVLKRFRLAYSICKAIALNILDQSVDFFEGFFVLGMPVEIFSEGFRGKNKFIHLP